MDPEIATIDGARNPQRNIPRAYERPGRWPATKNMANLPSVMGIIQGPSRTVHALRAQSQLGSSWNFPPFTALWPQGPGGVISEILAQRSTPLLDRLTRR